ncbi:MAG: hypothetical protein QF775_02755 [archaeon]|jgi:hypothetical protein|nr:hypothetical protein [Euryarchaeota archaeon]MDP6704381.1 hypothetical protein [archaeon]HIK01466.1 hypothetical protein [Candidatus Undinarchaeales archaeon ERR594346 U_76725]|tara:strand:- start:14002 stop:14250 length:249 start_codon:yes stop_codon:yes gene_type:complete
MKEKTKFMLVATLVIMLVLSAAIEARSSRTADAPAKQDSGGVGGQFLQSFTCIFTQCGWPAIIILILPVFGMWVYKKYFSLW